MMGLKLNHISKRCPGEHDIFAGLTVQEDFMMYISMNSNE